MFTLLAVTFTVVLAVGCGGVSDVSDDPDREFSGLITGVVARSLLEIDSIEVTGDGGAALRFHAQGRRFEGFTPSHVRGHMLLGLPVVVTYRESGGILIIVGLSDIPDERPGPS